MPLGSARCHAHAPRMPVSTPDFLAFWVGSRNPISCYCYPGWAVVLSHVKKSSEHILKSFRFRWCFVLPRSLSTFGSRRNGWSCQLLRSKWLHLRQLNFKNTGTRNCVSNNFWAEKKRRPEQSDQKNQTLPVTWESYCLLLILQCLLRSDAKFSCNFPGSPLMWRGATLTAYHCSKNCCRSWHQGWCACKKVCARELETIFPEKNPTSCFHLQVAVNSHQIFDPY